MSAADIKCVLLADRHHGLTEGVRGLLETVFEAVVMVADEHSLFESATRLQPTLAVVDLSLAREDNLQWLERFRARCPELKIIVLSVHDEPSVCRSALGAGADGFVLKRALATELLPAVDAVLAGQRYGFPAVAGSPGTSPETKAPILRAPEPDKPKGRP
jgi:two-component system secretion response regulator SsrB